MTIEWLGKKIYVKIKDSNRYYSGRVIDEDDSIIKLIDINGHRVSVNKSETSFIQEEK